MKVDIVLDNKKIYGKVNNPKIGLFIAHEWHRLINPYTPRDTGALMNNVDEKPFILHYKEHYAKKMYDGADGKGHAFNYRKINPFATDHWDVKAFKSGQSAKLYRAINNYLSKGE